MYRVRGRNFDIALEVITPKRLNEIICPTPHWIEDIGHFFWADHHNSMFLQKVPLFSKTPEYLALHKHFCLGKYAIWKNSETKFGTLFGQKLSKIFFSQIVRKLGYKGFLGCRIHFWCPFWKISSFWGNSRTILQ